MRTTNVSMNFKNNSLSIANHTIKTSTSVCVDGIGIGGLPLEQLIIVGRDDNLRIEIINKRMPI